jgi:hypothetical protein
VGCAVDKYKARLGNMLDASESRDTPLVSAEPSREFNARELALVQQYSESPSTILGGHENDDLIEVEKVQNVNQLAVLLLFSELAFVLLQAHKGELV